MSVPSSGLPLGSPEEGRGQLAGQPIRHGKADLRGPPLFQFGVPGRDTSKRRTPGQTVEGEVFFLFETQGMG